MRLQKGVHQLRETNRALSRLYQNLIWATKYSLENAISGGAFPKVLTYMIEEATELNTKPGRGCWRKR